jgi:hypothetical protein
VKAVQLGHTAGMEQPTGHPEPPLAGNDLDSVLGSLERMRATFRWKCSGVDAAGMNVRIGASSMTLGGLLKHLAFVEDHNVTRKFLDAPLGPPWSEVDWSADFDWEWNSAAQDSPEELLALWDAALGRCRAQVDAAIAAGGLDQLGRRVGPDGRSPSLRRLLMDLIEEYARHTGHADLIREAVDGLTGEDPTDSPYEYHRDAAPTG